ncbi:MAG TPA: LuxR C-terminal-related transcriptional regulator [Acidimicrobiales bacterium]|jgi:predicted ATPase/DNA-binding CsgD family transcriptional regulator
MGSNEWSNNLPEQLTSFVGRGRERGLIGAALATTRLLVLTGAGGAGKTRLALQVAAESSASFPDGSWWVEVAPLRDGGSVGAGLAGVLGVRPLPGRTQVEAVINRLGNEAALVILDNCEHLTESAADLAEALLRGCPRVVVLATSRVPLGVPGETDWLVPSLSLPREIGNETPEVVASCDSGTLFVDRAVKVRPSFALSGANAPAVAGICRELDGIPLAIELAAARVRMLAVEQIANGLSDRFRLLTGGPGEGLPRHRTLRASVEWSYELLSEDERLLFRRLAVFVGTWSLDAVEAVCAGEGLDRSAVLDILASLLDKSLVEVASLDRLARYRLLETLRQYALELVQKSGELSELRERHLDFFLALAERSATELDLPRNLEWLELLEPEEANFDAAIAYAAERDPERALRLCVALTSWWELGGRFAAGQHHLARALESADQAPAALRARALWSGGHLARFRGDAEAVGRYLPEALELAEAIGDEVTMGRALVTLGHVRMHPDPQGSRMALTQAMELGRKTGDDWTLLLALNTLGRTYIVTDDELAEGSRLFEQALDTEERTGLDAVNWAASGLAWVAMFRADHERCAELCERAAAAARQLREPVTEAFAHAIWVLDNTMQGRGEAALERALANEARVTTMGAGFTYPIVRTELARAHAALGDLDAARALLEVVVAGGADGGWLLCRALLLLGEVLFAAGDVDGALVRTREALELSERVGARSLSATGHELLARVAIERAEWAEASTLAHDALAVRFDIGALPWLPQSLDRLAQVAAGLESYVDAARLLGAAARGRTDLGLARWAPDAHQYEELEHTLTECLGADSFLGAWREGNLIPLAEAIGWARRARGTRKRPSGGWAALTATELQVVELVSQGLTNPQVAERMFIAAGTVKVHLAHIFQKLDIHSRSELVAVAVRRLPD